ncbi:MAG: hypothetical protein HY578_02215 [Nitrospinae bacterium]|nr:hypothetical protein [Nitrospinota bacterium]
MNDNYVNLILEITGGDINDLLPIREKDIELIDGMIESLDAKSKGRSYSKVF